MKMNISIVSAAVIATVFGVGTVSAQSDTAQVAPPGPYQAAPSQQQQPRPKWADMMPVPYWMQNRPTTSAPSVGGATRQTGQAPVYPTAPQVNRAPQFAPGWGPLGAFRQVYRNPTMNNGYYGMPGPYNGQFPPFIGNGQMNGFFGQNGLIYGYQQPAFRPYVQPQQ